MSQKEDNKNSDEKKKLYVMHIQVCNQYNCLISHLNNFVKLNTTRRCL